MRWRDREGSENVEDRRDETDDDDGRRFPFPIPGGGGFPGGGAGVGGLGIVGTLIVLALMLFFGVDPREIFGDGGGQVRIGERQIEAPRQSSAQEDEQKQFVSVVLKTTEDIWTRQFAADGRQYQKPDLVLFRGGINSRCGHAVKQMGPFYCPLDQKVYIDLSFYDELKNRFRAPGDFAQAYVIAHEVGHHVQTMLGITQKVMRAREQADETQGNAIQVRMELQADCLAGVWANHAQAQLQIVEPGDIDEALNAAAAIGDDRIQKRTQGYVVPDAFTHGSSEQRATWFRKGFDSGKIGACDTFGRQGV
jgi:predicted metalloprotease